MTIFTYCFAFHFLVSVSTCPKVSDAHLKLIWNSLRCFVDVPWRSHKKVHGRTASDEEPGGLQYDIQETNILHADYMIHENFDQPVTSQVCVLSLQLILSCQNCARKSVESKKSHGDHKAMEHGLENRLAILPISSYHPNFWRTELARTWKEPNDGWNSMVRFLCLQVLSSPISKASRTQRS